MHDHDAASSPQTPRDIEAPSAAVTREEVLAELARILDSPQFAQSERLGRFLRFTTEHVLSGSGEPLKEYVIGVSVYDRKPPYHPSQDSIVRTEARRLRAKLKEYYESGGRNSRIFIYYQPGNYAPVFRRNVAEVKQTGAEQHPTENELLGPGRGVRLAVLPFVDLSYTPTTLQAAHSLTDELTHVLAQTDGIQVAAHAAVEQMMRDPWDIPMLASKLDVVAVIEGTVRIDDGRCRITIRVVNEYGFQTGSHRFETLADAGVIAAVQEQVMTAFISRTRPTLSLIRKGKASVGSLGLAVYPVVIHGEMLLNEGTAADIAPALLKFQGAVEMAPLYARGHNGVAQCYIDLAVRGAMPSAEVVEQAIAAAREAVLLDPEMFGCYSTLASAYALAWQWAEAEAYYARAVQLGQHAPSSRHYALYLASQGRFEEGAAQLGLAQRIDPFSSRQKVAYAKFLHLAGRFEEMVTSPIHTGRYGAVPVEVQMLTALAAAHLGDHARARRIVEQLQANEQPSHALLGAVAEILALSGELERAQRIVRDYRLFDATLQLSCFRRALIAMALRDEAAALSLLEGAFELREPEMVWLKVEPRLRPLQDRPVYRGLVERIFSAREPQGAAYGQSC